MTLLVPNAGEVQLLTDLLAGGSLENWYLRLFKNDLTPAETDVVGGYTEADFTGYAQKTLTRSISGSTWATPTTSVGVTSSQYNAGSPQAFSCSGTGNTVYGYYYVGVTSAVLILAERFATARTLSSGDSLNLTPQLALD